MRTVLAIAFAVLVAAGGSVQHASAAPLCAESVLVCDADGDGFVDLVEEAVCGSATCATGTEDEDADGVPDVQQLADALAHGGAAGPLQVTAPDTVILVSPDGGVSEFSLWPLAGGAALFLVVVAAAVIARRLRRPVRGAHVLSAPLKELES